MYRSRAVTNPEPWLSRAIGSEANSGRREPEGHHPATVDAELAEEVVQDTFSPYGANPLPIPRIRPCPFRDRSPIRFSGGKAIQYDLNDRPYENTSGPPGEGGPVSTTRS
jgi:hypothetical protein